MTSPSAAHTSDVGPITDYDPDSLAAVIDTTAALLVDAGHASWCPACGGRGVLLNVLAGQTTTCIRCHGGRLNPYHGCTFTTDPPCTCTQRCQVYQPQETPTP